MSFGQNLKDMPISLAHDLCDLQNVTIRNGFVEKVAHGINKYFPWTLPAKWLLNLLRDQANIESLFKRMSWNTTKSLRKSFCITVLASGADLRAATYRIPRCVRPFDCCTKRHIDLLVEQFALWRRRTQCAFPQIKGLLMFRKHRDVIQRDIFVVSLKLFHLMQRSLQITDLRHTLGKFGRKKFGKIFVNIQSVIPPDSPGCIPNHFVDRSEEH